MKMKNELQRISKKLDGESNIIFLSIEMPDNSIFEITNPYQWKALQMKMRSEDIDLNLVKEVIIEETKRHWENRTVPTKYGWADSWEENIKNWLYLKKCDELEINVLETFKKKYGGYVSLIVPEGCLEQDAHGMKKLLELNKEKGYAKYIDADGKIAFIITHQSQMNKELDSLSRCTNALKWADKEIKKSKWQKVIKNRFKNMGELAHEVLYYKIRGFLMGIVLSEETKGRCHSILLGNGKVTKVGKDGFITKKMGKKNGADI